MAPSAPQLALRGARRTTPLSLAGAWAPLALTGSSLRIPSLSPLARRSQSPPPAEWHRHSPGAGARGSCCAAARRGTVPVVAGQMGPGAADPPSPRMLGQGRWGPWRPVTRTGRPSHAARSQQGPLACAASSAAEAPDLRRVRFCSKCGAPTVRLVPEGDNKERDVCSNAACGVIHYENPKVVVGAVCLWEDKILLCRRAIEPCRGKWGFPQGFLELGESTREGAEREAKEEACATIRITSLLAVYNIPNQVQLIYLADLLSPDVAAGEESLEAALFSPRDIPFEELAFPTVTWALGHFLASRDQSAATPQQRTKVMRLDESGNYIPGLFKEE